MDSDTAVDTPPLHTPESAIAVATMEDSATEDMDSDTAVVTPPLDTPDSAIAVATMEDSATEVTDTPVLEVTTASVRLRPSPRLMLMLRLIPTTDTVIPDLATLA